MSVVLTSIDGNISKSFGDVYSAQAWWISVHLPVINDSLAEMGKSSQKELLQLIEVSGVGNFDSITQLNDSVSISVVKSVMSNMSLGPLFLGV